MENQLQRRTRRISKILIPLVIPGTRKFTEFMSKESEVNYSKDYNWITIGKITDTNYEYKKHFGTQTTIINNGYEIKILNTKINKVIAMTSIDVTNDVVKIVVDEDYRHLKLNLEVFMSSMVLDKDSPICKCMQRTKEIYSDDRN